MFDWDIVLMLSKVLDRDIVLIKMFALYQDLVLRTRSQSSIRTRIYDLNSIGKFMYFQTLMAVTTGAPSSGCTHPNSIQIKA